MNERLRHGRDLERSLTLLRVFLLASALICASSGVALGWMLSHSLTTEALDAEQTALSRYAEGVVRPLIHGDQVHVIRGRDKQHLAESVQTQKDILSVKVWSDRGVLAWTNVDTKRIGRTFPLDDELGAAIHDNRPIAALAGTGGHGEDAFELNDLTRTHHLHQLFEVYAPIENKARTRAIGAYEIYANPQALNSLIGSRRTMLWLAVGGVFLALWAALALLVRGASVTLRRQTRSFGPERHGSSSPTGSSRRARSRLSRVSTRRSTPRIRTPRDTRSACSGSRSLSARSSASGRSSSTSCASPGCSTTSARSPSPTRSSRSRSG